MGNDEALVCGPMETLNRRENDLLWTAHERLHFAHEKAHQREHELADEAVNKADLALNIRLASMNEFREQLRTQAADFVTREHADACHKEINRRIDEMAKQRQQQVDMLQSEIDSLSTWKSGIEGRIIGIGAMVGFVVVIITIAVRFIP
jgi:hypothetical protein